MNPVSLPSRRRGHRMSLRVLTFPALPPLFGLGPLPTPSVHKPPQGEDLVFFKGPPQCCPKTSVEEAEGRGRSSGQGQLQPGPRSPCAGRARPAGAGDLILRLPTEARPQPEEMLPAAPPSRRSYLHPELSGNPEAPASSPV